MNVLRYTRLSQLPYNDIDICSLIALTITMYNCFSLIMHLTCFDLIREFELLALDNET